MKRSNVGKSFWMDRFGSAYDLKWKSNGKGWTQYKFAEAINKIRDCGDDVSGTVTSQQVSKWLHGSIPSEENLKAICEVLGVSEDYFTPTSEDERYKNDSGYITNLIETQAVKYCKNIDLDLLFLRSMKRMFGEEFGDVFPRWTPIEHKSKYNPFKDHDPYHRADISVISPSAQVGHELDYFQFTINVDGESRNIVLGEGDLRFIKEVQDKTKEYIEFLFAQRHKDMEKEVSEINRRYWKPNPDGRGFVGEFCKADDLNEVDKYRNIDYADPDGR